MTDIKKKIMLGGVLQKIHVRTHDESKPVLLFLHGGPGVCNRHDIILNHADLLDSFTVATWDQRGSGGSYRGVPLQTLTCEQLTDDAAELVNWLCERFHKDKIFVIGGSWGSVLGTLLIKKYPQRIAAFVGFGQVVDGAKNEEISFRFAMDAAKAAGDDEAVKKLQSVGPPVKGCYKGGFDGMMTQRNIMMQYGGYSKNEKKRSYFDGFVKPMVLSGEYTVGDLIGLALGHKRVLKAMWPEVGAISFPETHTEFAVPYFIFDGRLDMNTPAELVQEWYNTIKAPYKELIWFENSGHNPMNDEGAQFKALLRQRLLQVKENEESVI